MTLVRIIQQTEEECSDLNTNRSEGVDAIHTVFRTIWPRRWQTFPKVLTYLLKKITHSLLA